MTKLDTQQMATVPDVHAHKRDQVATDSGYLVDAHVHCHPCFDVAEFLDCAARNFSKARRALNVQAEQTPGCLLLAENPTDDVFSALAHQTTITRKIRSSCDAVWHVSPTQESCSLLCEKISSSGVSDRLYVVAGRQIVVREGVEVLALCTEWGFPTGRTLKSTLEMVLHAGALPVLPWGFGKWRFARGALIRAVLDSQFSTSVYLGDNSNRLQLAREPRLFRLAAQRGVSVLPGSDPLPLRHAERNAGRYGFFLQAEPDDTCPATSIKSQLREGHVNMRVFGRREGIMKFCINQCAMQVRKR